jgi:hypothetical protein
MMSDEAKAFREIRAAWKSYQRTEKHGLHFAKILYGWQQKLKGGIGRKGEGLSPMLETLEIPSSTAYYWLSKYRDSQTVKEKPQLAEPIEESWIHSLADHETDVCLLEQQANTPKGKTDGKLMLPKQKYPDGYVPPHGITTRPTGTLIEQARERLARATVDEMYEKHHRHHYADKAGKVWSLLREAQDILMTEHISLKPFIKRLRQFADNLEAIERKRNGEAEKKIEHIGVEVMQ